MADEPDEADVDESEQPRETSGAESRDDDPTGASGSSDGDAPGSPEKSVDEGLDVTIPEEPGAEKDDDGSSDESDDSDAPTADGDPPEGTDEPADETSEELEDDGSSDEPDDPEGETDEDETEGDENEAADDEEGSDGATDSADSTGADEEDEANEDDDEDGPTPEKALAAAAEAVTREVDYDTEELDVDLDSSSEESADDDPDSGTADPGDSPPSPESDGTEAREAKADGEGVVDDLPERDEPAYPDPDDDVGGLSTPPGDEEMPLADHIEEMILRLAVVLLVGSAATAIGLLWATDAIGYIWLNVFPGPAGDVPPPHIYHPLELWLTRIKVSALLGIMAALPMFVYQCYLFMRPGLYPHERKYYLAAVPTSVVLAALGMLFSFFLVLPVLFRYFTFYAEGSADIAYALGETFNLIITLTGFLAIVFQIPLFIMLAIMMGVTTRRWLAEKRLYFWAAFAGLSFMFTVDPTMMAPVLVAIVMILLFEGTLAILKWTGRE